MKFLKATIMALVMSMTSLAGASDIVNVVVPFPAGGTTDVVARYISDYLGQEKIESIVVNKGGAGGVIGLTYAKHTEKKNSTLIVVSAGSSIYAPLLLDKVPYDVVQDFEPVTKVATDSVVVVVPANSTINSVRDLVKQLKEKPGQLNYGQGSAIHKVSGLMLMEKLKASAVEIQYNGGVKPVLAVAMNEVEFAFANYADAIELTKGGRVKMIGIASQRRHPQSPDVKTFIEQGVNFDHPGWFAVLAPKGMDSELIKKYNVIIRNAVNNEKRDNYLTTHLVRDTGTPGELGDFLKAQQSQLRPLIEKAKPAK
jgi:tripartite-type tricarboxylate transporter receptor subunit TctC